LLLPSRSHERQAAKHSEKKSLSLIGIAAIGIYAYSINPELNLFLGQTIVEFGFTTIVIAHVMFQVSFVALTVRARIRGYDWTLEQAAQDLGASPFMTFRKVTLPLILPGIMAAALLAFALSIDDFIITFFNSGSTMTFPLQIFGASRVSISPQINVLATSILLLTVTILEVGTVTGARRRARHGIDD
jgi:spermidine/putrescine transport system permease protein